MFTLSIIIVLEDQTNRGRSDHWIEQDAVIVTTTKGISKQWWDQNVKEKIGAYLQLFQGFLL